MIAEYAAIAGAPRGSDPWALVLDVAQRAGQFEARRKLTMLDSVSLAIGGAFGETGAVDNVRSKLERIAYPSASRKSEDMVFPPNMFAGDFDG